MPGGPASAASKATATAVIAIQDFAYRVSNSVAPGAQVTVENMDQIAHTVTADRGDGVFDVTVDPGGSATFTAPSKPGSYRFHCKFHSDMHGTLVVK